MDQRRTRSRSIAVAIAAVTCTTAIARTGRPGITGARRFITRHRVITRRLATIHRPGTTRRLHATMGQALATVAVRATAADTGMAGAAATTVVAPVIVRRLHLQAHGRAQVAAGMATTVAALDRADRVATCGRTVTSVAVVMVDRVAGIAKPTGNGALRSAVFYYPEPVEVSLLAMAVRLRG